jgi:hypothetical protein
VIGGGWMGGTNPPENATLADDGPISNGTVWDVVMTNNSTLLGASFTTYAICA